MASPKTVTSHQRPLEFHELANTSLKAHFLCAAYITDVSNMLLTILVAIS